MFTKLHPFVVFDEDETAGGAGAPASTEPGTPAPEPASAPTPPAPVETPVQNDAPWSSDLATAFEDEAERQRVDAFLRKQVQPRITSLEQDNAPARALMDDLLKAPEDTLLNLAQDLWGDSDPDRVIGLARSLGYEIADEPETPTPPAETPTPPADLPDEYKQMFEEWQAAKNKDAYDAALKEITDARPDVDVDVFEPFVVSTDGDMQEALKSYDAYYAAFEAKIREKYNIPDSQPLPPVLGGDGAGGTATPPVAKNYASLDEAMDDFAAEMSSARNATTPVGAV